MTGVPAGPLATRKIFTSSESLQLAEPTQFALCAILRPDTMLVDQERFVYLIMSVLLTVDVTVGDMVLSSRSWISCHGTMS